MDFLKHYVRIHLTGAAAGIELFSRGTGLQDEEARKVTHQIRQELFEERSYLRQLATSIGASEPHLPALTAKVSEKLGRFKPNGSLVHRTELTDVIDLETMHDAVSGKVAGWYALLQVDDKRVDKTEVERLLQQGLDQVERLRVVHQAAARRAFA